MHTTYYFWILIGKNGWNRTWYNAVMHITYNIRHFSIFTKFWFDGRHLDVFTFSLFAQNLKWWMPMMHSQSKLVCLEIFIRMRSKLKNQCKISKTRTNHDCCSSVSGAICSFSVYVYVIGFEYRYKIIDFESSVCYMLYAYVVYAFGLGLTMRQTWKYKLSVQCSVSFWMHIDS